MEKHERRKTNGTIIEKAEIKKGGRKYKRQHQLWTGN